jgi:carboxyl-terminal processing protease
VTWLRYSGLSLLMIVAFGAGYFSRQLESTRAQSETPPAAFPLLQEAVGFVEAYFVKEQPPQQNIEYSVIRAYLASLGDGNTFFIEPPVAASESDALAGRYGGIGVDVRLDEQAQFVLYPFADSPAARVGIRDGDILLQINGQPLDPTATLDQIRQATRGEITDGAGVELTVRNQGESEEREYFIPFEEILIPSVTWRTLFEAPQIGYISISRFTSRTPDEFAQAVSELRAEGIQALVLDLRGNPGGLLEESLRIADEFLDAGLLLREERVSGETLKESLSGGLMLDLPLVVLVNRGTASASEIVAGSIQARERGILIGQTTFGKGSIQSIFSLSDQSSIHVTVAVWYTASDTPLDGVGLIPDIEMIPDQAGRDVELGEAVRYLQQALTQE